MTSWSKASIQMQFRAVDGSPVVLKAPPRARSVPTRLRSRKTGCPLNLISTYLPVDGDQASTGACSRYQLSGRNGSEFGASGSVVGPAGRAKTALASRIYVEGRHDAELVEKIWGDDLRHVGVVVEHLGGIDDLLASWPTSRREKGGGSGSSSITWCLGARSRASRTGSGAGLAAVTCWCWVIRTWTFGRR